MSHFPQFHNSQVEIETLPAIDEVAFLPLEKNHLKAQLLFSLCWILLLLIIQLIIFSAMGEWHERRIFLFIAIPVFIVVGILPLLFVYFGFFKKGYALREKDIIYKSGLIFRKIVVLPFNRVQHIEVNHGPIDRMYKLASLKLFTAGGSTSDLKIPGLSDMRAQKLKDFITRKTGMDEEE